MKQQIALIIEGSSEWGVWSMVTYDDNLIVESAPEIARLSRKMKRLLHGFHSPKADEIEFEIQYETV